MSVQGPQINQKRSDVILQRRGKDKRGVAFQGWFLLHYVRDLQQNLRDEPHDSGCILTCMGRGAAEQSSRQRIAPTLVQRLPKIPACHSLAMAMAENHGAGPRCVLQHHCIQGRAM